MTKKIIAFDLDDTLAKTKSPITDSMSVLLGRLLEKYDVCVISGGAFEQFKIQVIDRLNVPPKAASRLHIMPTCGTQYYLFNQETGQWDQQYSHTLTEEQKERAMKALEQGAKKYGYWETETYGDIIEDRNSQVTFSALGQQAPAELKYQWDPDNKKRQKIREYVVEQVPDLEVRIGGSTSVDVTMIGIDKAYGMNKLMEQTGAKKADILFIGDKLQEGGNDYPVKAAGIDTIEVSSLDETETEIERLTSESL